MSDIQGMKEAFRKLTLYLEDDNIVGNNARRMLDEMFEDKYFDLLLRRMVYIHKKAILTVD